VKMCVYITTYVTLFPHSYPFFLPFILFLFFYFVSFYCIVLYFRINKTREKKLWSIIRSLKTDRQTDYLKNFHTNLFPFTVSVYCYCLIIFIMAFFIPRSWRSHNTISMIVRQPPYTFPHLI
jgi:hypothetical protein